MLDIIVALILIFLYVAQVPLRFGALAVPGFEKDGLSLHALYVAIILGFIAKSALSWRYHDELKGQDAPDYSDQVPGIVGNFVFASRIFAGMASIGIAFLFINIFGGLKVPHNNNEWLEYGIFIGLPFVLGVFGIWYGAKGLFQKL